MGGVSFGGIGVDIAGDARTAGLEVGLLHPAKANTIIHPTTSGRGRWVFMSEFIMANVIINVKLMK